MLLPVHQQLLLTYHQVIATEYIRHCIVCMVKLALVHAAAGKQ